MEIICVDTDILINFSKKITTPLPNYLSLQEDNKIELFISSITVFEFFTGISRKKYADAESLIKSFSIKSIDQKTAKLSAHLNRKYNLMNKIGVNDIYIAATSIVLKAKLLTKNKKHFSYIPEVVLAK